LAAKPRIGLFGVSIEVDQLLRQVRHSEDDLDEQIQEAFDALGKSSSLVGRLEIALREREERLRALRAEHERISQMATLTKPQAEAVAASLREVLGDTSKRERWYAVLIGLGTGTVIYILGVVTSGWVQRLLT
jgi:HEAT repeat protein